MPSPTYITAATPDEYMDSALVLASQMYEVGHDLQVVELPPRESWVASCAEKPRVILEALETGEGHPVVWLDADARVHRRLELFEDMADEWGSDPDGDPGWPDLAAHWRDGQEMLSGTLWLAGDLGRTIARAWHHAVANSPGKWDQKLLAQVWPMVHGARVEVLPPGYCFIADFMAGLCSPEQVYISHTQMSRETRRQEAGR